LWSQPEQVAEQFGLASITALTPRYNIAPSQPVLAVGQDAAGNRKAALLRWGLVPHWAKEPQSGYRMINARAESLWTKPAFRAAARHRRCLIPADCFYEWRRQPTGPKQPFCIRPQGDSLFAFAAIWERFEEQDTGRRIDSCAIVTTRANDAVAVLHDRMPVIIAPQDYDPWLDHSLQEPQTLQRLLGPCPAAALRVYPVGPELNRPANDYPDLIQPQGADLQDVENNVT